MKTIVFSIVTIFFLIYLFSCASLKPLEENTFRDRRDGRIYKTVTIGEQIWMAENLAYNVGSGSWNYDNDRDNISKYGRLYKWETALDICPKNWHLPSDKEWKELELNLGMSLSAVNAKYRRGLDQGTQLKSDINWTIGKGTNESGFSAFPAGKRSGHTGSFSTAGINTYWWTATSMGLDYAWYRGLSSDSPDVYRHYMVRSAGLSVRCVSDKLPKIKI